MQHYFLSFLENLRRSENVVLYTIIPETGEEEKNLVEEFLHSEFENEQLNFPFQPPHFDGDAAMYAASTMYILAQLIVFREHNDQTLSKSLELYHGKIDASAILSADLVFRFLPDFQTQFRNIDFEDTVLDFVEKLCKQWHYSAIASIENTDCLDFDVITSNKCLKQLYIDRIIEKKNRTLASLDVFKSQVEGVLSIYENEFWKNYTLLIENKNEKGIIP